MTVELYLGDCLEIMQELEDGSVDAVVTDPPYGIKYKSGKIANNSISSTGKRFSERVINDDIPFNPDPFLDFRKIAFTGAQHFYERLPKGGSLHCWDKRGNYKPLDQADADFVWISNDKKSRVIHLVWRGICRQIETNQKYLHPTQKPIALMRWIMDDLLELPDGATILDPFMGSGTTGVACVQTGRNFIGIEIEPKYFEIAEARIAEAQLQIRMEI